MALAAPKCSHIVLPSLGHVRRESQRKQLRERRQLCRSTPTSEHSLATRSSSEENHAHADNTPTAVVSLNSNKRLAVLKASKSAFLPVKQLQKPLADYMTLPASQYSVLDAKRIERLDADTFKCYVGGLHFLNFHVEPVLTLSVIVGDHGPTVKLLSTELQGSKAIVEVNRKFTATMTNVVRWENFENSEMNGNGEKQIRSDVEIQVTLEVPGWFVLPIKVIEKSGCAVMQRVLNTAVPRFLQQLEADYQQWASGAEERISSGELLP